MTAADRHYDLRAIELPRLEGATLRLVVALLESPLGRLLLPHLQREAGVAWFRRQRFDEPPTFTPLHPCGEPQPSSEAGPRSQRPEISSARAGGFHFATVHDYARAYRDRSISPDEVADRVLQAIASSNEAYPPLRAVIAVKPDDVRRQAEAATKRFRSGRSLGPFDGVPVGVKDEVDMVPYPTTAGTTFIGKTAAASDSTVVARLRAAGALLIGKLNMHEIGLGVTGFNPFHGTPRNPYAPNRHTGGSSSGSAAAVAAGICPVAVAADGGGSIRIPAALCGVVGLKPTFGRVSEHGAVPLCWSVAHIGPIGATATDVVGAFAIMAGPDQLDPTSLHQPSPVISGCESGDLRRVTIGVFRPWFDDADEEITKICNLMIERLCEMGACVRDVIIPDLEAARVAHSIIIGSEMAQAMSATQSEHHRDHGDDVRISLRMARSLTADDYVKAQRVRTRMIDHFRRAFADVDVIATPTTPIVAPPISDIPPGSGVSDFTTLSKLMRFVTPANLTGLPAISFPAGYTANGLPVGLQVIGRPWDEALLLRLAWAAQSCLDHRTPGWHHDILGEGEPSNPTSDRAPSDLPGPFASIPAHGSERT